MQHATAQALFFEETDRVSRIFPWAASVTLHVLILLSGIYLAQPKLVSLSLDVPVYEINLVTLTPQEIVPAGEPATAQDPPEQTTSLQPAAPVAPTPEPQQAAQQPDPVSPPMPAALPRPAASEITAKMPPAPKQPAAYEITAKVQPLPTPQARQQARSTSEKHAPKLAALPEKTRKQLLKEALGQAQKDVSLADKTQRDSTKKELEDIRKLVAAQDASKAEAETSAGRAQDEFLSLSDIYADRIIQIIRQNWRYPAIPTDTRLTAQALLRISPDGIILESRITAPSGRPDFDASVLRAVEETHTLPAPPGSIRELHINFNLEDIL